MNLMAVDLMFGMGDEHLIAFGYLAHVFSGFLGATVASFLNVAASGENSVRQNILKKKVDL